MEHCHPAPTKTLQSVLLRRLAMSGKQQHQKQYREYGFLAVWLRGSLLLIGWVMLLMTAPPADAGTVTGHFTLAGGGTIAPKAAAAYPVREQYDARAESFEIVLSNAPIDAVAAANALSPHTEAINQDALRQDNYILLWVSPDGQVSMNATFGASMTQYLDRTGSGGRLRAALTMNTPTHIAGRVFTPAPVKVMSGDTYICDITFAVDVTHPAGGTLLPPGGGEPGRAFVAMLAAAKNKNWDALLDSVSLRLRDMFDADYRTKEENLEYAVDLLQTSLPRSGTKVTRGILRGETATLEIEGEIYAGQTAVYFVKMLKSRGHWSYDGAVLAGMVK